TQEPALLARAHLTLGESFYFLGEFAQARVYLEQGLTASDFQQLHLDSPADFEIICLLYQAFILWYLGHPDQALQSAHQAFSVAQELSHFYTLVVVLDFAALFHQLRREEHLTRERAEAAISLATEHGVAMGVAWGTILRGWALTKQGQGEEGTAQLQQGLAAWQATGTEMNRPYYLALLAEAYGKAGQVTEGLTVVAEALAVIEKTGERFWEAEVYRLKGELTFAGARGWGLGTRPPSSQASSPKSQAPSGVEREVEACFHKAIAIAREQKARSLELRAVVSLSRLWQSQGKKKEARELLAPIYGWFTEGFGTKDLQEAKALLEELSDYFACESIEKECIAALARTRVLSASAILRGIMARAVRASRDAPLRPRPEIGVEVLFRRCA
ncbi:MAG: hypothetical protein ACRERD_29970, partial [Candidatus Binatia bacterium]